MVLTSTLLDRETNVRPWDSSCCGNQQSGKPKDNFEGKLIDHPPSNTWGGGFNIYSVIPSTIEYGFV